MLADADPLRPDVIATERCALAFRRLVLTFVFMVDVRISFGGPKFDVLPDTIGWLVAAQALRSISDLAQPVAGLRKLAAVLAVLNLFNFAEVEVVYESWGAISKWHTGLWPIDVAIWVLDLLFVWRVCALVVDLGSTVGRPELSEKADFRRRFYLVLAVLTSASGVLLFFVPASRIESYSSALVIYAGLAIPATIVLLCLLIGLMRRAERACRGYRFVDDASSLETDEPAAS